MYNGWWLEKVVLSVCVCMEYAFRIRPDERGNIVLPNGALAVILFQAIRVSTR